MEGPYCKNNKIRHARQTPLGLLKSLFLKVFIKLKVTLVDT